MGRGPWAVDQLTRRVFERTLPSLLAPSLPGPLSPQAGRGGAERVAGALLAGLDADAAAVALDALPPPVQARLDALSPLVQLDAIHARRIVLCHDEGDNVIPVGESRRLQAALGGRAGVRYVELASSSTRRLVGCAGCASRGSWGASGGSCTRCSGKQSGEACAAAGYARGMDAAPAAVLFDFDGTLGTYRPAHLELYVRAAAEQGVRVTVDALRPTVERSWQELERRGGGIAHAQHSGNEAGYRRWRGQLHRLRLEFAGARATPEQLDAIGARIVDIEADPAHFELYADALPALQRLQAGGIAAYIVSNHMWRLPEVAAAIGLGPYVRSVLTSARVGYRKPHPRLYDAAIAAAGRPAGTLLFVGDHYAHDVEGPRAAGMRAVLLDRAGTSGDASAIHTLAEVPLG
ncbi:MAG: HAD family hydrolase [Chloroflexi bacterium]|nr:HAD family hydrolase [Chloroflexota bacterium]